MRVLSKEEILLRKDEILGKVLDGIVFIHPTDTIYGLGCDATNKKAVAKIRELKKREKDPFSVIAPSKKWIKENCIVNDEAEKWLKKLPGPYTFILKLKKECVASNVNPGMKTLGVRIPNHWVKDIVNMIGVPIVTTSANQTGKEFMTSMDNLDPEIKKGLDFAVYEGEKKGRPSKLVHLEGDEVKVRER
ncbi:threonylcarbamoyl-AMP synthase [Candidatus Woesearchaeota archaeon]|nr:threonylcarbamoyl-AMP synthase [Candidatus Woesearchaeota archaeon]